MKPELFEQIFGSDFTLTNYEVSNPKDLLEVLDDQREFLEKRLYNFDDQGGASDIKLPIECKLDDKAMFTLIELLNLNGYFVLSTDIRPFYILLQQRLKFIIGSKNKLEFLQDELMTLEKVFSKNNYNDILSPDNYYNELRTSDFIYNFWRRFKRENRTLYRNYIDCHNKQTYSHEDLLDNIEEEKEFAELMIILQKFTLIKYQISLLDNEKKLSVTPVLENKYPSIFTDVHSLNLFNYLIENEEKNIGRAYVTKYFNLFIDENRIRKKARKSNFLRFLKTNHQLEIKKLDNRTTYSEEESNHLSELEKEFNKAPITID